MAIKKLKGFRRVEVLLPTADYQQLKKSQKQSGIPEDDFFRRKLLAELPPNTSAAQDKSLKTPKPAKKRGNSDNTELALQITLYQSEAELLDGIARAGRITLSDLVRNCLKIPLKKSERKQREAESRQPEDIVEICVDTDDYSRAEIFALANRHDQTVSEYARAKLGLEPLIKIANPGKNLSRSRVELAG